MHLNYDISLNIDLLSIASYSPSSASDTLRIDRRHCLAIDSLEINIWHVVYSSEVYAIAICYCTRECGGSRLDHWTKRVQPYAGIKSVSHE